VPHFWTCSGPTGSGKTYAATTFACERIPRNVKSVFIQPTIALCKQSYVDARARFPDIKDRVRTIVTRRGADDKVPSRITKYLNGRDESGDLLHVTHAGFLRTPIGIAPTRGTCSSMRRWKSPIIGNFGSVSATISLSISSIIMGAPHTMRRQEGMTDE
jgi:hypothetical protein